MVLFLAPFMLRVLLIIAYTQFLDISTVALCYAKFIIEVINSTSVSILVNSCRALQRFLNNSK